MFLKLHVYAQSADYDKKPVWINFNRIGSMHISTFRHNGNDVTVTILTESTAMDANGEQPYHRVHETPEIICELLKENTTVKVLFGGN